MNENTHPIENLINFDDCMEKSYHRLDMIHAFPQQMVYRIILVLSLTTGLDMKFICRLKWRDLLILGPENDAIMKDELRVRKYLIPLHHKVKFLISDLYCKLGYPNLDTEIIDSYPKKIDNEIQWILIQGSKHMREIIYMDKKYFNEFNFETYTQVLFGRKVFEVFGYTNSISKFLKQHFGFRLNEELFNFLGYKSKEEIKYHLKDINLDANVPFIKLEDKNFNDGYQFQKFTAFSKFLLSGMISYRPPVTNSIRLLLLMSLYNGIRPSKLIRLKWYEIIEENEEEKSIGIKNQLVFENQNININEVLGDKLLDHFQYTIKRKIDIGMYPMKGKRHYKIKPDNDNYVFVTNKNNPLTQPSLSREIKKALLQLNFPHAEKMNSNSTIIMYGRRIIEIKGDHKPTIKKLMEHFKFKSKKQLFDFLYLGGSKEKDMYNFKGKIRKNIFEGILYDY